MKRWVCASLLILLVSGIGGRTAAAQTLCYPITSGDTAARIAERLTGDPRNHQAPWFEIVDERWRRVSKAEYAAIRPGWLACLSNTSGAAVVSHGHVVTAARQAVPDGVGPANVLQASIDFTFLLVAALLLAALSLLRYLTSRARRRRERAREMRRFGARFVQEFGRPMTQFRGATPPPRARLRVSPRRSRVEILLAPADRGGYPNLADHRSNVEYDVARVMAAVGRESFVNGPPYAEGHWVVLPFHFKGPIRREGAR